MKRLLCLLTVWGMIACSWAFASGEVNLTKYNDVLAYIQTERPMSLDLGQTKFSIAKLKKLKEAMPEGAAFDFQVKLCGEWIDSQGDTINLDGNSSKVNGDDLAWLIASMPNVKKVQCFNHRELSNDVIIPLIEQHPEIEFGWLVRIHANYVIRSDATAFSTNKSLSADYYLTEKNFELLKYVPGIKALDIGHNHVTDISWLKYFPEMTVLILADNRIEDISPLAELHDLEYLELFMNKVSDVSPLAELENLRDLNLCRTKLTDTDLSVLDGLNLERFWCTQAGVSEEEQERFKAAHPNTYCNFTVGSCTDDGWRDSYKYDQFRAMFHSRTWAPFKRPE